VWARLLDDGVYLCSISTMYRLLAAAGENRERRRQRTHPARKLAYSEIHDDERACTAVGFWRRARTFFAAHGITVKSVLTDNGACCRSKDWHEVVAGGGATPRFIRPPRPQTNGKVERSNRTLLDEWAYARKYSSESERRRRLDSWLHTYNHHRCHTALGGRPPISRVDNVTGHYS
jgi:transposase InsO family protein